MCYCVTGNNNETKNVVREWSKQIRNSGTCVVCLFGNRKVGIGVHEGEYLLLLYHKMDKRMTCILPHNSFHIILFTYGCNVWSCLTDMRDGRRMKTQPGHHRQGTGWGWRDSKKKGESEWIISKQVVTRKIIGKEWTWDVDRQKYTEIALTPISGHTIKRITRDREMKLRHVEWENGHLLFDRRRDQWFFQRQEIH